MRTTRLLMELESLAEKLGIQVSYESLPLSRGGLCRVHGKYLLIVEKGLKVDEKIDVFIDCLSRFDLSEVHVLPKVRRLVEGRSPGLFEDEPPREIPED